MKSKTFKNMEIMQELKNGQTLVLYSKYDMGNKYKVYKRLEGMINHMYIQSFENITAAYEYAKFISQ